MAEAGAVEAVSEVTNAHEAEEGAEAVSAPVAGIGRLPSAPDAAATSGLIPFCTRLYPSVCDQGDNTAGSGSSNKTFGAASSGGSRDFACGGGVVPDGEAHQGPRGYPDSQVARWFGSVGSIAVIRNGAIVDRTAGFPPSRSSLASF